MRTPRRAIRAGPDDAGALVAAGHRESADGPPSAYLGTLLTPSDTRTRPSGPGGRIVAALEERYLSRGQPGYF